MFFDISSFECEMLFLLILICISLIFNEVKHLLSFIKWCHTVSFFHNLFIQHDGYLYPSTKFVLLWTGFSMQLFIFFLLIGRNSFYVTWCVADMLLTWLFPDLCWLLISGSFNTVCYYYLCSFLTWLLLTRGKISWNLVHPS